jgi:glucose/arabinose dehydrogenase
MTPHLVVGLRPPLTIAACLLLAACTVADPSPSLVTTPAPSRVATVAPTPSTESSPTPAESGSTNPPLPTGPDRLRIELVASGLVAPVGITSAADGSGRLFVNEQGGAVRVIGADGTIEPEPFVDLANRLRTGGERGLLGLAFHPDFVANRRLFVHYSRASDGATVVSELRADADGRHVDAATERVLLTVTQPFANHNGGQIAFGPDGYLYIGLGDGGSGGDPFGNAQNRDVLLGKILRIDVDETSPERGYGIPPTNPFAAGGVEPGAGAPEIWAYGLRNPWRFSFDPEGGDLYIGDVGQGRWEEIDRQPGDSRGGENYGWNVMEGRHCYETDCDQAGYVKPIAEYSHDLGCSVSGGYVYRGSLYPSLAGIYVFGDYCSGTIFTLNVDEGTITPKPVLESGLRIGSFGRDERGELYVADIAGGAIYRLRPD